MPHQVKVVGETSSAVSAKKGDHVLFTIPGKYSNKPGKHGQLVKFHGIVTAASAYGLTVTRQSTGDSVSVKKANILKVYPKGTQLQITVK